MNKLLVIIPDILTDLIKKGEIINRYYNPGNIFDEVHIMMTNHDKPDPNALQRTVGKAKLFIHNIPEPDFRKTCGFHPLLLYITGWAKPAVNLAKRIKPNLIRCHGNWLNGYLACRIKKKLGIPYVVSMHTNPDEELRGRAEDPWERRYWKAMRRIEKKSLQNADMVLPVYKPIVPYLQKMGVGKFKVAYNVLNCDHLQKKESYDLHHPVRIISVGRHFKEKNPENIIRAIEKISNANFTLVGHGSYQEYLVKVVEETAMKDRVTFLPAVSNDELCKMLPDYDIFAIHTEYWEISKSLLEALLTGLPVVINKRKGEPVQEFDETPLLLVENTPESYYEAIKKLIKDHSLREDLGRRAYDHAQRNWSPEETEAKYVEIYKEVMRQAGSLK